MNVKGQAAIVTGGASGLGGATASALAAAGAKVALFDLQDELGNAKAKEIGEAFRKLRIPVGQIQSSVFNRAIETGTLMGLGEVTSTPDLAEGGLVVTPIENNRRAQALRKVAATVPPAGTNIVVVTHKPNILDAFGKEWFDVREGEASVFQPGGGGYKLIVRVQADEWSKLAQAAPN